MSEISRQSPNVLAQGRFRILLWFRALKVLHYISELVTELETSTSSHLYQNASGPDSGVNHPSGTWAPRDEEPKPNGNITDVEGLGLPF